MGIFDTFLFVDLVANLRHFWSRSGTLRDLRVREGAFSTIPLIFNHFRRIRRPLSGHKELDRAPCKPAGAGTPGVPKPGVFATAGGDLPTPKGPLPPAAAPSSPDYHAAPKAPLVGRRDPFGVARIPCGVAKKCIRGYNIGSASGVPRGAPGYPAEAGGLGPQDSTGGRGGTPGQGRPG